MKPPLNAIVDERRRQDALVESGDIPWNLADPDVDPDGGFRLAVLGEEFGEVARALLENGPESPELRDEITQTAAVCLAWLEALTNERSIQCPLDIPQA